MSVQNTKVADCFFEIADLLDIEDANPFRVRAYRNAARMISTLDQDLGEMLAQGKDLRELPGIGADLAEKIREIVMLGKSTQLERLRDAVPGSLGELLQVPGLGPKRVRVLFHDLGVQTLEQLSRAAHDGRIRGLHGFGEKVESQILLAVEARRLKDERVKLVTASSYADALLEVLTKVPEVDQIAVAGSLRRMRETIGDIDLVAGAKDGEKGGDKIRQAFVGFNEVADVLVNGTTKASVRLKCGMQVDLRIVEHESFGAALCYLTGSKAHGIALRRVAQGLGLKLNEYGLFRGRERIAGIDEASIYRGLGMAYIAPELREDRGEIEAAQAGHLPLLVERNDLRGDLHVHTRASDGRNGLREMAQAAQRNGLEYIAITEHSRRLAIAHGLDESRLLAQCDEIDQLNVQLQGITLLKGIEVDILEDGSLDLPDTVLAKLDVVVAAVHSRFGLSRAAQTDRILRAMNSRFVHIIAHPSGRLIGSREPYDVDMAKIISCARERGIALELNAHPDRLDLLDTQCQAARQAHVPVAINSDAHAATEFSHLRYGIGQARRGWLEAGDVLNTRTLQDLKKWLLR
jgi:DNA polymerase (family X)